MSSTPSRNRKGGSPLYTGFAGCAAASRRRANVKGVVPFTERSLSLSDRLAHLAGDLREGCDALFERRVIHEQLAHLRPPVRRDDEEGVHAGDLAQVLLG